LPSGLLWQLALLAEAAQQRPAGRLGLVLVAQDQSR
jgi:hypothetical protein